MAMTPVNRFEAAVDHLSNNRADLALQVVQPLLDDEKMQPQARQLTAVAHRRQGKLDDAIRLLEQLVTDHPGFYQAWYNLGVCYGDCGEWLRAIVCYRSCLRGQPQHSDAMWNLADALRLDEQFEQALLLLQKLRTVKPYSRLGDLHHRIAVCLMCLGRAQQATDEFEKALRLGTDNTHMTMWESSFAHLITERFDIGWLAYEHRFAAGAGSGVVAHQFQFQAWQGQSLKRRCLLIHAEQGLGDQLMFASIIPELISAGASLVIAVNPSLVRLFEASFSKQTVLAHTPQCPLDNALLPQVDYQIAIGSLANFRRPSINSFKSQDSVAYLKPTSNSRKFFSKLLDAVVPNRRNRRCIGVVWGANPCHGLPQAARRSQQKSLPVQHLAAFSEADREAVFVSLQNHEIAAEAGACAAMDLIDCHRYLDSMEDTAGLIANLDLVITVDTSVAHLAAGMGIPTWLMLMRHADWRWGQYAEQCLWYPSVRIFRQQRQGDWSSVISTIASELMLTDNANAGGTETVGAVND